MEDNAHRHEDLHERLLQLEQRLEVAEAALATKAAGDPGPRYYESGNIHPELDDQTIAP